VVDVSDPYRVERQADVDAVLESIGAERIPVIRVFNKIDLSGHQSGVQLDEQGRPAAVSISAAKGEGLELLRQAVSDWLASARINRWIVLDGRHGRLRAQLFELGVVSEEQITENGAWLIHVDVPRDTAERLARLPGLEGRVARQQLLESLESAVPEPKLAESNATGDTHALERAR
jgi:GTP-binding protein HflX